MKTLFERNNITFYLGVFTVLVALMTGATSLSALPPTDTDGDGVPDQLDNCPTMANPERIVFTRVKPNSNDPQDPNSEIMIMNADGSALTNLTPNTENTDEVDAEFHPNGSKIVFMDGATQQV